jgi:hypothetical protein
MFLRLGIQGLAVLGLMALPVAAECVNYVSFTKGVRVKLADGSVWSVHRQAHDVIRIEEAKASGNYAKYVVGPYGVYQTESTRNGSATVSEYHYIRTVPEPKPGMDWTSNVKAVTTKIGADTGDKWREKVHVTAGAAQTLKVGACRYEAFGLDIGHVGGPYPTVQHFTYFPDLRFGIQTRITYPADTVKKAAIISMTAE